MDRDRRELPKHETPFTRWLNAEVERAQKSQSPGSIASAAGISSGHLSMLRYGDRVPEMRVLAALARVLGASRADGERAREETLRLQKSERAERMTKIKSERNWERAWRHVIYNTHPEFPNAVARANALGKLVDCCVPADCGAPEVSYGNDDARRPQAVRKMPPADAVLWLVGMFNENEPVLRVEAARSLGKLDSTLAFRPARTMIVESARRDRDIRAKEAAKEVLARALMHDIRSTDPDRQIAAFDAWRDVRDFDDPELNRAIGNLHFTTTELRAYRPDDLPLRPASEAAFKSSEAM